MTKETTKISVLEDKVTSITCDRCGLVSDLSTDIECEWMEFLSISRTCGYFADSQMTNNRYGDCDTISVDLCQKCTFEVLGPYLTVTCPPPRQW